MALATIPLGFRDGAEKSPNFHTEGPERGAQANGGKRRVRKITSTDACEWKNAEAAHLVDVPFAKPSDLGGSGRNHRPPMISLLSLGPLGGLKSAAPSMQEGCRPYPIKASRIFIFLDICVAQSRSGYTWGRIRREKENAPHEKASAATTRYAKTA